MDDRATFLALHLRLCTDSSNALSGYPPHPVRTTPEGHAWLRDYSRYARLYRKINEHRFAGTGPADLLLAREFDVIPEPADVQPE